MGGEATTVNSLSGHLATHCPVAVWPGVLGCLRSLARPFPLSPSVGLGLLHPGDNEALPASPVSTKARGFGVKTNPTMSQLVQLQINVKTDYQIKTNGHTIESVDYPLFAGEWVRFANEKPPSSGFWFVRDGHTHPSDGSLYFYLEELGRWVNKLCPKPNVWDRVGVQWEYWWKPRTEDAVLLNPENLPLCPTTQTSAS